MFFLYSKESSESTWGMVVRANTESLVFISDFTGVYFDIDEKKFLGNEFENYGWILSKNGIIISDTKPDRLKECLAFVLAAESTARVRNAVNEKKLQSAKDFFVAIKKVYKNYLKLMTKMDISNSNEQEIFMKKYGFRLTKMPE